jgi:succinate dehydrogenase / fumarate reductase cytochrome b subunit
MVNAVSISDRFSISQVSVSATEFRGFMAENPLAYPPTTKLRPRPLSPHLQVYRWQWTMALSIAHRATGIFLSLGALYLVIWLLAIAGGADSFATIHSFNVSIIGRLLMLGWTFSLFYHLCNGIRHLVWDAGWGLDLKSSYASALAVLAGSVGLTVIAWVAALAMGR